MTGHPQVLIVAGLGRCGTSLVMQMLERGGIRCFGEFPAYESGLTEATSLSVHWLGSQRGSAVKILDPHLAPGLRRLRQASVIWCNRDVREQAKSQLKFAGLFFASIQPDAADEARMAAGLVRDRVAGLETLGHLPLLEVHFEHLLFTPATAAAEIAGFVSEAGFTLDSGLAATAVRERGAECLAGLLEFELLEMQP